MDPNLFGIIGLIVLVALIFLGVPVPVVLFLVGFFGTLILKDWGLASMMVNRAVWSGVADFNWSVIPLFILLSVLVAECGIGENIFRALQRWIGHVSGGMAAATSGASAFLGCITGVGPAAIALMSRVAYPEMRKANYEPALSLAAVAAPATVAMLIPPSTNLVIYAIITEQSVAQVLLGGFIPGFLSMGFFMVMLLIRGRFSPGLMPASPVATWRDRFIDLRYLVPPVIMLITIVGGLYFGIFTATEAAGAAALISFIIVFAMRRLTHAAFKASIYETLRFTVLILFILLTVRMFFTVFLNLTWLTVNIAELALEMPSPWLTMAAIFVICFILGMFVGSPLAYVTLPLFVPVVEELGFEPIWFIIVITKLTEVGYLTPPIAPGLFIAQGIIREVPMEKAYNAAWWFIACDMLFLVLIIFVPQIVMFLPNSMRGV